MVEKSIGRKEGELLADQLPINAILYKHAIEWVKGFAAMEREVLSKAEFKSRVVDFYNSTVENCRDEKDIEEIIRNWKRWGYLPKSTYTGKRSRKVRHS